MALNANLLRPQPIFCASLLGNLFQLPAYERQIFDNGNIGLLLRDAVNLFEISNEWNRDFC
jgi:hypothetical protein